MHPLLASSDFDPFQMTIIVIALIAGFIKWLWENWQGKPNAEPPPPADAEEQRLREAAWRRQTGQGTPPPLPPPAAPSAWDELRKVWRELQEQAGARPAAPRPVAQKPPPAPAQQVRRGSVRAALQTVAPAPVAAAPSAPPEPAPSEVLHELRPREPSPIFAPLFKLQRDPALLRQAILMQEILGTPKALQTSDDPAI